MGKAAGLLAGLILVLSGLMSRHTIPVVRAQTASLPCSGSSAITPMQGHYTGPWHSDGDYHFLTMGYDVNLKVIIDGSLDLTVAPDGHVSGTASGKVDAPIYDSGQKDVSSGYGTITGSVTGVVSTGGSLLVLTHPVILMHWGTFVGGGYTADRYITMPDYRFTADTTDCISGSGTITEKDFPVQYIIADGAGQMSQAPGIGAATGTWRISGDKAPKFTELSQQVDSFIAASDTVLAGGSLQPSLLEARVLAPLRALVATISADPDVARCLMERLGAWERSTALALFARAAAGNPTDLPGFRAEGDLLRSASTLGADCLLTDNGTGDRVLASELAALRDALETRAWSQVSLLAREILLWRGAGARDQVQTTINAALHAHLQTATESSGLLELARIAYILGDGADSTAAYKKLTAQRVRAARTTAHKGKKKKKPTKPKPTATPRPKPTATPRPKPTATSTPTATPQPKTLEQVLATGVARIDAQATGDSSPSFSWRPVAGAARYIVAAYAEDGTLAWSWSGSATDVRYGDTAIDGLRDSSGDGWPISLPTPYTWTVTALDSGSRIVGLRLR